MDTQITKANKGRRDTMDVKRIVSEVKCRINANGGLQQVFFVGCGGSKGAIFPGYYLLKNRAKSFGTSTYNSSEFIHELPERLGPRSVCICCSLKATKETVLAVEAANRAGAVTIAMTGGSDTEMANVGQYVVVYSNGPKQIYSQSNQSYSLRLAFEILHQFEDEQELYAAKEKAFARIDDLIVRGKGIIHDAAYAFARENKDAAVFEVLADGSLWGAAYSMASCHYMEMQWKYAIPIHSGEYFHGPFETTDKALPIVLMAGTGRTRALDERALKFIRKYAGNVLVLDCEELGIKELPEQVAEYFCPVMMIPVEKYAVSLMAEQNGHSMDERRYMWKVEY